MSRDLMIEAFSFIKDPGVERIAPRTKQKMGPARQGGHLLAGILCSSVLILPTFHNAMGFVRIRTHERVTKGKPLADTRRDAPATRPASSPRIPVPQAPRVIKSSDRPLAPRGISPTSNPAVQIAAKADDPDEHSSDAKKVDPRAEAQGFLKQNGIVLAENAYVLESESDVKSKLVALRNQAKEFNEAYEVLFKIKLAMNNLEAMHQLIDGANTQIAQIEFQMKQFPAVWRRGQWFHGNTVIENEQYQQLKLQRDLLVKDRAAVAEQRNTLARQQPGRDEKKAATAYKEKLKDAHAALDTMRTAITATKKRYEDLAKNYEVKKALAQLGQARLVPSAAYDADVNEFGRFEQSIGLKRTFQEPKKKTTRRGKR